MKRFPCQFHNGKKDGLIPLEPLDLNKVDDFDDLLRALSKTAFGGRQLGDAADVLTEMVQESDCVVGTFSGAMTIAKMGLLICEMLDRGWLQVIVATGALISHGLVETLGMVHYRCPDQFQDKKLFSQGYDRVYDTLELEVNLDYAEKVLEKINHKVGGGLDSSSKICWELGKYLAETTRRPGILRSAYLKEVPVFIPAFTDCELGLDLAYHMVREVHQELQMPLDQALRLPTINYNPFIDLGKYAARLLKAERPAIFTIGGGVPRNWAQQVSPYLDLLQDRIDPAIPVRPFQYGVRICPEPPYWGGLSGCSYSEGVSWGKFVPPEEGGRFAEVFCDATIAWPVLLKAVMQRVAKAPPPTGHPAADKEALELLGGKRT